RGVRSAFGALGLDEARTAFAFARRHLAEIAHVETGAERAAFAGENDGANTFLRFELFARFGERLEHRIVQRVHLVGAHETNVRDAAFHFDFHAIVHWLIPGSSRAVFSSMAAGSSTARNANAARRARFFRRCVAETGRVT